MPSSSALRVAYAVSDLSSLADSQAVALVLLSVASRPLPIGYSDLDAETFSVFRRDLWHLSRAAGLEIPCHRFNRALDALLSDATAAPAIRYLRHGGKVRVALSRPFATPNAEEGWRALLAAQRLRALGHVLRHDLARVGLDIETALPLEGLVPVVAETAARARRCLECESVRSATQFGTQGGRLRDVCLACASSV